MMRNHHRVQPETPQMRRQMLRLHHQGHVSLPEGQEPGVVRICRLARSGPLQERLVVDDIDEDLRAQRPAELVALREEHLDFHTGVEASVRGREAPQLGEANVWLERFGAGPLLHERHRGRRAHAGAQRACGARQQVSADVLRAVRRACAVVPR
eukprot:scaffold2368_cov248-Pinguiococcus_pyrenoidosus.AAC.6